MDDDRAPTLSNKRCRYETMNTRHSEQFERPARNLLRMYIMLFACMVLLSVSHQAQAKQLDISCTTESQLDKYLLDMWGQASPESQKNLIDCLQSYWFYKENADIQEAGFRRTPSAYMVSALQFNPVGFFTQMDSRQKFYNEWVSGLAEDAFTWYRDPPCALAGQMWQMKILLKANKNNLRNSKTYRSFMKIFMPMECTQID